MHDTANEKSIYETFFPGVVQTSYTHDHPSFQGCVPQSTKLRLWKPAKYIKYHQLKHVRNPTSRVSPDCNCMPASCNAHLTFEKATSTLCSVGRYSMTYAAAAKHQFNMFGSAECISRKRWKANIPDLLQNYALELRLCSDRFLGYLNASCGPFNTIHLMSRVV